MSFAPGWRVDLTNKAHLLRTRHRRQAGRSACLHSGVKSLIMQRVARGNLDAHPAGPPEKWPKWSSDQAINTEFVIIIGSESWFLCFDGKQPPGTGLGAACEADDVRTRIYKSANVNENIRVVLLDDGDAAHISSKLEGYHRFHAERDFNSIVKWLGGTPPPSAKVGTKRFSSSIPNNLPRLQPFFGREKELAAIREALDPESRTWGGAHRWSGRHGKDFAGGPRGV